MKMMNLLSISKIPNQVFTVRFSLVTGYIVELRKVTTKGTLDEEMKLTREYVEAWKPRDQHYAFAHVLVAQGALCGRNRFLQVLLNGKEKFLLDSWAKVASDLEVESISPAGLALEVEEYSNGKTLVIITLPEVKGVTECYYVGIIFPPLSSLSDTSLTDEQPIVRTLEFSRSLEQEKNITMFCAWELKDGKPVHLNFGEGPEPGLDEFRRKLVELLLT